MKYLGWIALFIGATTMVMAAVVATPQKLMGMIMFIGGLVAIGGCMALSIAYERHYGE